MNILKNQIFIFGLAFLFSCTGMAPPHYPPPGFQSTGAPPQPSTRSAEEYNNRVASDRDREETLRSRRQGKTCEDENSDHECVGLCREMYRLENDREDCEELAVNDIEKIFEIHKLLKKPRLRNLEAMSQSDLDDLDVYLNVSIAGFDRLISNYNRGDAREVLQWLAEDSQTAELFSDEDDDFETFEELLEKIESFDNSEVDQPFTEDIGRKTLFEHASDAGNEIAVEWFLDYIFQTATACRNNQESSIGCFTVICKIGSGFEDNDSREDLLDFSDFENFLEDDIIKKEVNGTEWEPAAQRPGGSAPYKDIDDIEEHQAGDWVTALCDNLI